MPSLIPFSPQEAVTKVGRRVRVVREHHLLPVGTTGTVIGVCATHRGLVVVRWDLPPATHWSWEQWFGKTTYQGYLAEINQESDLGAQPGDDAGERSRADEIGRMLNLF